jgi:hypothetical protein
MGVHGHTRAFILLSTPADAGTVLRRALRLTSSLCCAIVVVAFAVFANDQLAGASAHQQNELVSGTTVATSTSSTVPRAQPWRFIADAASRLTSPFSSIVPTHNVWVMHCLGAVFALIVYGIGLGWVARFSDGRPV